MCGINVVGVVAIGDSGAYGVGVVGVLVVGGGRVEVGDVGVTPKGVAVAQLLTPAIT